MAQLFEEPGEPDDGTKQSGAAAAGVVGVAVAAGVWGSFDYAWPGGLGEPRVGQRVRVPFGLGNRKTLGFVIDTLRRPTGRRLKAVAEVVDVEAQLDEALLELGRWISHYYLTPLGMTLAAMIPSAVGRHSSRTEAVVYLQSARRDWPGTLGHRQRRVLDELYEARKQGVEPLVMESVLHHSGAAGGTIQRLVRRGLVRLEHRPVCLDRPGEEVQPDPFDLNEDQKQVLSALEEKLTGDSQGQGRAFSVTLLHGVTGSGKTEIYIRAIRRVIAAGRQAILLVPEIALATQTIQRLLKRLPRVAVLHSGLTDSERAFHYEQVRDGHAGVVVGPRSAVFAPTRKLGLIIVDEEHESTYKQDTAPRYHGRDVAVKRGSLVGVPVILGSATPSMESLHNARQGRYDKLELPRRVRGLPMPKLRIVHLRRELLPGRVELIGRTLTNKIAAALDRNEQIILLMNRRGYASFVFCPSCKWEMSCDNCARAMVFHQATQLVMCHYCRHVAALPEFCPACRGKLLLFGMGIQRVEGELARKFPEARTARMDSDTMTSPGQFRQVFERFGSGELDILLGTQMVAKGLDFPRVSLVGIASADTSLMTHDFRAAERTFQLIVQVAGRAGRAELPGEVVVQTLHGDEPAVRLAAEHDYAGFASLEISIRREAALPPFTRMVRFIVRHEDVNKAQQGSADLAAELRGLLGDSEVTMVGPQQAYVPKIRNRFRFEILLSARRAGLIQQSLHPRMGALCRSIHAEVVADADPVNMM